MISLRGLNRDYVAGGRTVTAVRDIDLDIERGEFVVITGRSGCGKTTLLNLIAGLAKPTSGTVVIDGVDLWRMDDDRQARLRNERIGFIFQFPSLLPSLTTLENVLLPVAFRPDGQHNDASARAEALLRQVGLGDKLASLPRQLSAGQQQRVVVARALILEPEIILADEPTSDLDEQTEHEIMDLLGAVHRATGITVVLVTHAGDLVPYGTRAIEMAAGAIVRQYTPAAAPDRDCGEPEYGPQRPY